MHLEDGNVYVYGGAEERYCVMITLLIPPPPSPPKKDLEFCSKGTPSFWNPTCNPAKCHKPQTPCVYSSPVVGFSQTKLLSGGNFIAEYSFMSYSNLSGQAQNHAELALYGLTWWLSNFGFHVLLQPVFTIHGGLLRFMVVCYETW